MSTMEDYKEELARFLEGFGANVRRVRTSKVPRFSQERLSYTTGLHRTEIGKIEQGIVEPRLTTLLILADGLGVNVDELVAGLWVPTQRRPSPNAEPGVSEPAGVTRRR
jgi:transcriptional regulator with XRE-family HTH domain